MDGWLGCTSTQDDPADTAARALRCWFASNDDAVDVSIDGHRAASPSPSDRKQLEGYEGGWHINPGDTSSTPGSGSATATFEVGADQAIADVWLDRSSG